MALSLAALGCSGGAGSSDTPPGENPGIPSSIQLRPAQFVAQTNSLIFLKARVFDGNGHPLPNVPVTFTNLTGGSSQVLNAASVKYSLGRAGQVLSSASVVTDLDGYATVSLFSSVAGFATIQAELNVGSNQVRDKKTVFFTSVIIPPTLILDVDSNNNGIFDEPSDFILLNGPNDNQAIVRATVFDQFGRLVSGINVTFSSDDPAEVTFPFGSTVTTDPGQASVFLKVIPTLLTDLTRPINITASASNGAFNMITLFLEPVTIDSISVIANPQQIASAGTSDIFATITTSAGTPPPDGTTVNFALGTPSTAPGGTISSPFAQTTAGVATITYTGPTLAAGDPDVTQQITGSVAGLHDSVTMTTVAPPAPSPTPPPTPAALSILPLTPSVSPLYPKTQTFTINGGTSPYNVASSCAKTTTFNDNGQGGGIAGNGLLDGTETNAWTTSGSFVVTVPLVATPGVCVLTVTDSVASSVAALLFIN